MNILVVMYDVDILEINGELIFLLKDCFLFVLVLFKFLGVYEESGQVLM